MTTQHTESAEDSVTFKEESLSQRGFSFFFFIFISLHIHFYMLKSGYEIAQQLQRQQQQQCENSFLSEIERNIYADFQPRICGRQAYELLQSFQNNLKKHTRKFLVI